MQKSIKMAQYAAFMTFIFCTYARSVILIFSHISIILALGHDKNTFDWYHNKPYITDLWIINPLGRTRILSYNLDNSLLDLLFWWRIWTRRPRPREKRRRVMAPSASARQRLCFFSSHEDAYFHITL